MFGRSTAFTVQDTPRPPAEAKLEALYREQQQHHARERPPAPAPPMGVPARPPTSSRHASRQAIDAEDPRSPLQGGPPRDSPWSGFGSLWEYLGDYLGDMDEEEQRLDEEEQRRRGGKRGAEDEDARSESDGSELGREPFTEDEMLSELDEMLDAFGADAVGYGGAAALSPPRLGGLLRSALRGG